MGTKYGPMNTNRNMPISTTNATTASFLRKKAFVAITEGLSIFSMANFSSSLISLLPPRKVRLNQLPKVLNTPFFLAVLLFFFSIDCLLYLLTRIRGSTKPYTRSIIRLPKREMET